MFEHFDYRPQLLALRELGLTQQLRQAFERYRRERLLLRLLQQARGGGGERARGFVQAFQQALDLAGRLVGQLVAELVAQPREVIAFERPLEPLNIESATVI